MSPQVQGTQQDEQAIRTLATEFVAAWNRNDGKALGACFASDGDLINPQGRVGRNQREVEKILTEEQNGPFKGSHMSMPQKYLRFLKPDLAIADYDFEIAHVRGAGGKDTNLRGEVSNVLRKEGNRWLIGLHPLAETRKLGTGCRSLFFGSPHKPSVAD